MDADMMREMVSDFLFDGGEQYNDLVLDGDPYYDGELGQWVQDCHDSECEYWLVDYGGDVRIEYRGTY